ncbi:ACP S-malonyltransferase [Polyangium sorediatum]|uniref:Malonyl CoA-acyl carrier protein transacylase n=1 Tax=Polyangium sorediatum TaxID=889274 RepID=A0ABT6P0N9_9BACT|nr:ACP S-malonyltransferase [Polyangium sorediatum]MDI1434181.1 ACP S-malonyltransferase [Polyangium sorediatum]
MQRSTKVAWLFPGQGSQLVGMGKELAATSEAARRTFERADAALGEPLSQLCFEGPMEELTLTANTQPAIVAASAAIVAALRERHPDLAPPVFAAGHSLGEYSALCAAGAIELEDAVRLCRLRGSAMQAAVPSGEGAMSAIMGLDAEAIAAICEEAAAGEIVSPANYNAPGQVVIAGHKDAVARAGELVVARGGKAVPLKVSAPFHCALMRSARDALAPALERVVIHPLVFPVIANVDASPNVDPGRVAELLLRQIDGAVLWSASVERMAAEGVTHALELGPGKVLAGLGKRIAKSIKVLSVSDPAGIDAVPAFLEA